MFKIILNKILENNWEITEDLAIEILKYFANQDYLYIPLSKTQIQNNKSLPFISNNQKKQIYILQDENIAKLTSSKLLGCDIDKSIIGCVKQQNKYCNFKQLLLIMCKLQIDSVAFGGVEEVYNGETVIHHLLVINPLWAAHRLGYIKNNQLDITIPKNIINDALKYKTQIHLTDLLYYDII